jgi:hypothetical protein
MKKTIFSLVLMLTVAASASAQSWKDLLGKVAGEVVEEVASTDGGNAVTNVLGAILGTSLTLSDEALEGTWNYEGVACVLESEDALSDIGGTLVTSTLESKLDEKLASVGLVKGNCSFTFVKDGTCVINVGGRDLNGKYVLDAEEKVITFTFMYDKLPIKTYVSYEIQNLNVVFKADRLLSFIKNVAAYFSNSATGEQLGQLQAITQTIGSLGTLLQNYDGMMLGVKLSRVGEAPASSTASNSSSTAASVETATETTTEDAATKAEEAVSTGSKILKGLGGLFKK